MSVQALHRFKRSYHAVLIALFAMTGGNAFALTLGSPIIQSEQHEPLSATIPVSGIDADTFSANIAQADVHQQMGMSVAQGIQVRFVKTSDSTGNLVLSSSAPISAPFADVVMSLNDSGQSHLKPQTLLLPISTKGIKPAAAANDIQPELPLVSGHPLAVENSAPPPLFSESASATIDLPSQSQDDSQAVVTRAPTPTPKPVAPAVVDSSTNENTNAQLEILTKQVTTQIVGVVGSKSPVRPSDDTSVVAQETPAPAVVAEPVAPQKTDTDEPQATYVVQSGDSLWKIASEIAKANNLSVQAVMDALHKQNPHAFNSGDINQLKAKAALSLPNYDVIPSQKAIQEAISARKSTARKKAKPTSDSTASKTKTKPNRPSQAQTSDNAKASTSVRPLPKAQVTLVTPSKSGQETGTSQGIQTQASPLVSSLKDTRAQVAKKAKKVNTLKETLSSATQKLQLQNQKLAELEARLKALKDK